MVQHVLHLVAHIAWRQRIHLSRRLYGPQHRRFADRPKAITDGTVLATAQNGYGVDDAVLVNGRNHERAQSLEATICRVEALRRDGEFNRFEGEERGWENDGCVYHFP